MKLIENEKPPVRNDKPTDNNQFHIVVAGCKVKLNFPPKPDNTVLSDVKRIMLGGAIKK